MASYDISSDSDLKTHVRALTGYDDNQDELPQSDLDTIIETAKMNLDTSTGASNFYSDDGLTLALLGTVLILSKASVENASVSSWTIGDQSVEVRDSDPETSQQIQTWNELFVIEGLNKSTNASSTGLTLNNTSDFIA